jgi:hypothetical protein
MWVIFSVGRVPVDGKSKLLVPVPGIRNLNRIVSDFQNWNWVLNFVTSIPRTGFPILFAGGT